MNLIRKTMCILRLCETFKTADDENGLWGECVICGKKVGYVSRTDVRSYIDREIEEARRQGASDGSPGKQQSLGEAQHAGCRPARIPADAGMEDER